MLAKHFIKIALTPKYHLLPYVGKLIEPNSRCIWTLSKGEGGGGGGEGGAQSKKVEDLLCLSLDIL